jgi:hypothetical protein
VKKLCQISSTGLNQTMLAGGGFLNDGLKFTGYPVVGYNNYMQSSSGCQPDPTTDHNQKANICLANANHLKANDIICGWDSRVNRSFFFHTVLPEILKTSSSFMT